MEMTTLQAKNLPANRTDRNIGLLLLITLAAFSLCIPSRTMADDYLDTLEAEADTTTVLKKAQKEHEKLKRLTPKTPERKATVSKPAELKATKITKTDNMAVIDVSEKMTQQFETALYKEFPGNYAVYTSLSTNDKKQVVRAYQQASNIKGLIRFGPALSLILNIASQ